MIFVTPSSSTDHIEADTKISYLLAHASDLCEEETEFEVRSASGDVDIPVILIGNCRPNTRVYLDNGTGRSRQILDLSTSELDDLQREAVIGFHAFTGNDCISFFL